ncbi:MAG: hypothetical protein RLZZ303_2344 [Candidatus Hydrogenedentota bacterium]|jgi:hypothetical protein
MFAIALLCFVVPPLHAQPVIPSAQPELFGDIQSRLAQYDVILRPDRDEPEWWAGAPSVARGDDGTFWLAARMRTAESKRGLRGYEIRILRSKDGVKFEHVHSIKRDEVPIPGFERPALLRDPTSGNFKLYACGPWKDGPWAIIKFADAESPDQFDPTSAYPVITAPEKSFDRDIVPVEYKDPVIVHAGGKHHAYVTGYIRQNERIFHFTSDDGESWLPVGNVRDPVMDLAGWHDFFVRPSSLLPLGVGYLFVYEGSDVTWHDPVYNIGTGLAFTMDLHTMQDLTPDAPLLLSCTPSEHFATFRYSSWLRVGEELWIYAEVACPNETHEIRLYRLPME